MKINEYDVKINYLPSNIFGLINIPKMIDLDNDADWLPFTRGHTEEVTKESFDLVDKLCRSYMTDGIMEIGVSRNGPGSFTNALLKNKPPHIPYLGIDIEDKSYINNSQLNIYTIQISSDQQTQIRNYMHNIGMKKISILFIDGWHSLNAVINDWKYSDLLSDNGIIFLHDTNGHPGPTIVLESIDTNIFSIKKYFKDNDDYGLSTAIKLGL